jgi:uncharacterized protein (TIRG00374 family)
MAQISPAQSAPSVLSRCKRVLLKVVPFAITVVALYIAFHDVDWRNLWSHLGDASPSLLLLAFSITIFSYIMRSRRWQFLFPKPTISLLHAAKVLILGFFMNNILPARAGEFVRAHMGAQVTGEKRTLVLATIASERLADGLMLSLFFVAFALGSNTSPIAGNLLIVAIVFGAAALGVLIVLLLRTQLISIAERITSKFSHGASSYAFDRFTVFLNGLSPLATMKTFPIISLWTLAIWLLEFLIYVIIARAFNAEMTLGECVLFLVTLNFSSLIPSAPGAIGVIEAVTSSVLISIGIPKEQALTMVLVQHAIQYLVVGIPGAFVMITWKKELDNLPENNDG